ncbi:hypothetical protein [Flavobacterium sp. 3HN19-14]|uniref:hypothetical protein n=1 Tax=Flavobacterium sp. 3HN19-14 TaxID=3448133 RepID=UPI003EE00653
MYDQLGSEGFNYSADGNGYTSNVINWNSAVAFNANNEFTPGNSYKTLTLGYSSMFNALFDAIVSLAKDIGIDFQYHANTRLHSILSKDNTVHFTLATREHPNKKSASKTADAAWMAMPRGSIDLVAEATRYQEHDATDVLNHEAVQLYLESAVMQPSYKVGMFFKEAWWLDQAKYPAAIIAYEITPDVLKTLASKGFPADYLIKIAESSDVMNVSFADAPSLFAAVEKAIGTSLTSTQQEELLQYSQRNTIGHEV